MCVRPTGTWTKETGGWRYDSFIDLRKIQGKIFEEGFLGESNLLVLDIQEFCEEKKSSKIYISWDFLSYKWQKGQPKLFKQKRNFFILLTKELREVGFRHSQIQPTNDVIRTWVHPISRLCFFFPGCSLTSSLPCGVHMAAASPHLLPGIVLSSSSPKGLRFNLTWWAYNQGRIRWNCRIYSTLRSWLCPGNVKVWLAQLGHVLCPDQRSQSGRGVDPQREIYSCCSKQRTRCCGRVMTCPLWDPLKRSLSKKQPKSFMGPLGGWGETKIQSGSGNLTRHLPSKVAQCRHTLSSLQCGP